MTRPLLRALCGLIASWWRSDRIRISPREGELLRLRPGSVLAVNGIVAEVCSKTLLKMPHAATVRYDCQTGSGPARLDVHFPDVENRLDIVWSAGGRKELLRQHEIEVFG